MMLSRRMPMQAGPSCTLPPPSGPRCRIMSSIDVISSRWSPGPTMPQIPHKALSFQTRPNDRPVTYVPLARSGLDGGREQTRKLLDVRAHVVLLLDEHAPTPRPLGGSGRVAPAGQHRVSNRCRIV